MEGGQPRSNTIFFYNSTMDRGQKQTVPGKSRPHSKDSQGYCSSGYNSFDSISVDRDLNKTVKAKTMCETNMPKSKSYPNIQKVVRNLGETFDEGRLCSNRRDSMPLKYNDNASDGVADCEEAPADKTAYRGDQSKDNTDVINSIHGQNKCLQRQDAFEKRSNSSLSASNWSESKEDINTDSDTMSEKFGIESMCVSAVQEKKSSHRNLCSELSMASFRTDDMQDSNREAPGLSSCSSSTSLVSNASDYKIEKRKETVLEINGKVVLTKIETVEYSHQGKKSIEHYVRDLKSSDIDVCGDTGLKRRDLLLRVNGHRLENVKRKKVIKIFKKIKADRKDGEIRMTLEFRRWEKKKDGDELHVYEVDYQLTLVLKPVSSEEQRKTPRFRFGRKKQLARSCSYRVFSKKEKCLKETVIPKGCVDNVDDRRTTTGRLRLTAYGPDKYIMYGATGEVIIAVPSETNTNHGIFIFSSFKGSDRAPEPLSDTIFVVRISPRNEEPKIYLGSNLQSHQSGLSFQGSNVIDSACDTWCEFDETYFIIREIGQDILFESLIYRGHYISTEEADGNCVLKMVKKSDSDIINKRNIELCKFQFFGVEERQESISQTFFQRFLRHVLSCVGGRSSRNLQMNNSIIQGWPLS